MGDQRRIPGKLRPSELEVSFKYTSSRGAGLPLLRWNGLCEQLCQYLTMNGSLVVRLLKLEDKTLVL